MRAFASEAAVAFAIANLYLLYLTGPLVSPGHQLVFHLPGSATALFVPVLLDVLVLTFLLFCCLLGTARDPRLRLLLYAVLLLPVPAVLLKTVANFAGHEANARIFATTLLFAPVALALVAARLRVLTPRFQRLRPTLDKALGCISLAGLLILGHLFWDGWQSRHLNPPFVTALAGAPSSTQAQPRVVWLILDELSFQQVFSDRAPGLALPNLDRLAAEAAVLTDARAAAEYTRIAIPSLLTGLPLSATNPTADGRHLLLHPRGVSHWQTLNPSDTVFADLHQKGLPTGIAGWYEPYCRLLPTVLDRCFWTYSDDLPAGLDPDASVLHNTLGPARVLGAGLRRLQESLGGPVADEAGKEDVLRHRADFHALSTAGDRLLQTQKSGLLLLHMPIPHPWGFYDRRTGTFPPHRTSYLDNLVLADLYLAHIRSLMEADGSWEHTNLIVMGDHGWRAGAVWRQSGFWTTEEDHASQTGTLKDHPAMLVKLAGQQHGARINAPFAAHRTRALINALAEGKLQTADDLKSWIEQTRP